MNVRLLRKIQKHILAESRRFAMGAWISKGLPGEQLSVVLHSANADNHFEYLQKFPECGTVACIGGWAELLSKTDCAYTALDLTRGSAPLFVANIWPEPFRSRYAKAKTAKTRARIAVERIDLFIKTEGRE